MEIPAIYPAMSAPAPAPHSAGLKWFLIIIVGLILVIGTFIAVYYITGNDHPGVKVIRMEGTISTGDFSNDDSVGSEYVGNQLREAADDPMVEAIVLRVDSPGGTRRQQKRLSTIWSMQRRKSRSLFRWETWPHPRRTT